MRLSICIPIFNEDVNALTQALLKQVKDLDAEILLYDDGSAEQYREINRPLEKESRMIKYYELPENTGRSAIRNTLARNAQGEYLLFLDCDSTIISENFIQKYLQPRNCDTVSGGTVYPATPPDNSYILHWKYGSRKEAKSVEERQSSAYGGFHSNNFLIRRSVFDEIRFNEKLRYYGHEDTFFGFELRQQGKTICQINNPVLHNHLEKNEIFLQKTRQGLDNLLALDRFNRNLKESVSLLKTFYKIEARGLSGVIRSVFKATEKSLYKNLTGDNPSLTVFSFYKLGYFCDRFKAAQKPQ